MENICMYLKITLKLQKAQVTVILQGCTESVKPLEGNLSFICNKVSSTPGRGRVEGGLRKQKKVFWATLLLGCPRGYPWELILLLSSLQSHLKTLMQQHV